MHRLNAELLRLFLVTDPATPHTGHSVSADGAVRAMVLALSGPAAWSELGVVWQGVQVDMELPAPAIAVSGTDALQLWFSVDAPVGAQQAEAFVRGLQQRYLPELRAPRVRVYPWTEADGARRTHPAKPVPALQEDSGNWSAFVSPDLAAVFGDEPWLDLPPNADQQADMLSRVRPMSLAQFRAALPASQGPTPIPPPENASARPAPPRTVAQPGPREFLLAVMNNPALEMRDRIAAAKALLQAADDSGR